MYDLGTMPMSTGKKFFMSKTIARKVLIETIMKWVEVIRPLLPV